MIFNITDFGAVGNGKTVNTSAIQCAVDACSAAGGGTVVVPAGIFVSGTVFLKSNITFHVSSGGTLLASSSMDDYCPDDAYPQNASANIEGWRGAHLLAAVEQENIVISGPGTIDGNCGAFFTGEQRHDLDCAGKLSWARGIRVTDPEKAPYRPGQMITFVQCRNIRVMDIDLKDSPCWTCFFHGCREVIVRGVVINNPVDGINTDGIDIDCCTQVVISDCIIRTGDDAITLRASGKRLIDHPEVCEDIAISNCVLDCSVSGFRIGVGSGIIRNAVISNISIRFAGLAVLIQSSFGREGAGVSISGITFSNIRGHHTGIPIKISAGAKDTADAKIRNILFDNFHVECCGGIVIAGNETNQPENITVRNSSFQVVRRDHPCKKEAVPTVFFSRQNTGKVFFSDTELIWLDPEPEWEKTFSGGNDENLILKNCSFPDVPEK